MKTHETPNDVPFYDRLTLEHNEIMERNTQGGDGVLEALEEIIRREELGRELFDKRTN